MKADDYKRSPDRKCAYDASKVAVKVKKVVNVKPLSDAELEAAILKAPVMVGIEANSLAFMEY